MVSPENILTMAVSVLGETAQSEDTSYVIPALSTQHCPVLLPGEKEKKLLRTGIGFSPQGRTIWHMEGVP